MSTIQAVKSTEAGGNGHQAGSEAAGQSSIENSKPAEAVQRVYVDVGEGVRVPVRKINLISGEPVFLYDTAGPQDHDIREGLSPLRDEWIRARGDCDVVAPGKTPRPRR